MEIIHAVKAARDNKIKKKKVREAEKLLIWQRLISRIYQPLKRPDNKSYRSNFFNGQMEAKIVEWWD